MKRRAACVHCQRERRIEARGLCGRCYTAPSIREQYRGPLTGVGKNAGLAPAPGQITRRAYVECLDCGTQTRSRTRICRGCQDGEPSDHILTGGRWVTGRDLVARWVPSKESA
ncbi:hypothetical protein [Nocardioides sp.]|uniref:hypothetical protein n=1 Tax=Nocardioides sp. TaxID=35761 RepID=UPI003518925B